MPTLDLMTLLRDYVREIDAALADTLAAYTSPPELYEPVRYLFEAGGKRIRPVLVLLSAEAVGGRYEDALHAAVAAELLHNFTLVHDDIMDRSPLRRGRPTMHVKYNENTAILSGDVMMGLAMRLAAVSAAHAPDPVAVHDVFAKGFIDVCEGQAMDMAFMRRANVTVDEYFHMIERKTARLLEMCVSMGAMIGGGTPPQVEALRTFARDIGVAFQLQDDLLDLDGSDEFGKAPGGDLVEGKRTWLVLRARDRMRDGFEHCKPLVEQFFAHGGIARQQVPQFRECLVEMGVIEEARRTVQQLTDEAFVHLNLLPDTEARQHLAGLARMLMGRSS